MTDDEPTIAEKIIWGLQGFNDDLEAGNPRRSHRITTLYRDKETGEIKRVVQQPTGDPDENSRDT